MKIEFSLSFGRDRHAAGSPRLPREKLAVVAERLISQAENQKSSKTIENYRTAVRAFLRCVGPDFLASGLSPEVMEQFAHWLREQGVCPNTASCYMRSLRSLLAMTGGKELTGQLFSDVFTGNARTVKRAVDNSDIRRLQELALPGGSYEQQARDLFLFCFYAQGLPFVDAVRLQWSQVSEGTISYLRQKTGQRVSVGLDPLMTDIMLRYREPGSDWVFPLFHPENDRDYQQQLNRYNRALKRLAAQAGISRRLTSYVARHSWASMAYRSNVDLPIISKALGHTNPQTTLIYVKEISDNKLAEANRHMLDSFR